MEPDVSYDTVDYVRRFQAASDALDSAAQTVAMARLVAQAQRDGAAGGHALEGGERLRAAHRIGLLATSMNPLTHAHVALGHAARAAARLDALAWVATTVTIDKEQVERATLADRLLEARAHARASSDGLLLLAGGLYVEQARAAHALLAPDATVALIVGFDKVAQIFDARYYADRDAALHELFAEAELVVAPREGAGQADLRALMARPENRPFADRVSYCPLPARYVHDSSTEARALVAAGASDQTLRALLTPEGLALAQVARPYVPAHPASATDLGDVYTARQACITALGDLPLAELASVSPLSRLVAWSAGASPRGSALRAWVSATRHRTSAGLRAALDVG
jgi:nicotinic acid mononucleotide adenylyltransferase